MPQKEKTREMLRIAESLDSTAVRLAGRLDAEHIPARPVPLYLPVRMVDGRVQGVVRLKQIAAAGGLGEIGKNTVLLTSRFGPRVLLSGVVTAEPVRESERGDGARNSAAPLCTGCGSLHPGMPERSNRAGGRRCVPVPDRPCLGAAPARPGREVAAPAAVAGRKPRPACAVDRQDGNDPVQPLRHRMPVVCGRRGDGISHRTPASRFHSRTSRA